MSTSKAQKLAEVKKLADQGFNKEAWNIVEELALEEPNDALTIVMGAYVMHRTERLTVAYYMAKLATQMAPSQVQAWMEFGRAAKFVWQMEEAQQAYRKAIQLSNDNELRAINYSNLASCYIDIGQYKTAEPICLEALKNNPAHQKSRANYGICLLARGEWKGWDMYSACIDTPQRANKKIGTEPTWNGEKGKSLFIIPEQGLGDEISFASMFPDVIRDSERVVIECEPKLTGLFTRSFPTAKVYGTRRTNRKGWDEAHLHPDASILAGELGQFYRREDKDFPGTAYLTADPDRRKMWKALFESKGKPVIGVAWTGGTYGTAKKMRRLSLEQLLPVFKSVDAHWVSLQYTDASDEINAFVKAHGIDLVQYPWATLTPDYDDTAAMVSELDSVVCMQTCVAHLSGALGKEAFVFIPERGHWRWAESGDRIPWYDSVRVIREKNGWAGPINRVANILRQRYATAKAA